MDQLRIFEDQLYVLFLSLVGLHREFFLSTFVAVFRSIQLSDKICELFPERLDFLVFVG